VPNHEKGKEEDKEWLLKQLTPPVFYFPHAELASSPGNPVFNLTQGKFGPFEGQVIIGDQTRSNLMHANIEKINGEYQGAVFNMVDHLQSGCIRIGFAPDGALWVGQNGRGWKSVGGEMYGVQVVRWDGKTIPFELHSMNLTPSGFRVNFTAPIDPETVKAEGAFAFKHWTYKYHGGYGSPKMNVTDATPQVVSVSEDRQSVELKVDLVKDRVYQLITEGLRSSTGQTMTTTTGYYTINQLR
jgi:hypothetical protein